MIDPEDVQNYIHNFEVEQRDLEIRVKAIEEVFDGYLLRDVRERLEAERELYELEERERGG